MWQSFLISLSALLSVLLSWWLGRRRAQKPPIIEPTPEDIVLYGSTRSNESATRRPGERRRL